MDNLMGLLGLRRVNRVPNARIREVCEVAKAVDERIDQSFLCWLGYIGRKKESRIRAYI